MLLAESLFKEMMAETFPDLGKDMDIQLHEAQRSPISFNLKKTLLKHIIIEMSTIKDKENLESCMRKETHNIQGKPHKAIG